MNADDQGQRAPWEAYLTADEGQRLQEIASEATEIDDKRRVLTRERKRIIDRAARRRLASEKRAQGLELRWAPPEQKVDSAGAAK